jgi:hypothetical protein
MNTEDAPPPPLPVPPPAPKRRGCLFYGCLGGLVILLAIAIGGLLTLRYAKKIVSDLTDQAAEPLPQVTVSPERLKEIRKKVDDFRDAVKAGKTVEPLSLDSEELNALIQSDPDLQSLKGKVYVSIEGNQLKGRVSVPLEQINAQFFKGRYLNGTGTFNLSFRNGALKLFPDSIIVKGKPVGEDIMSKFRTQNFAKGINQDPRASVALEHIESITVADNQLIITPKPPGTQ